jgi:hypothetical protein
MGLEAMNDQLELSRCGCCDNWVAAIDDSEVEDACPLAAIHRVLMLAIVARQSNVEARS